MRRTVQSILSKLHHDKVFYQLVTIANVIPPQVFGFPTIYCAAHNDRVLK